jgi:propanol-preferring alcohol dehydrogenase
MSEGRKETDVILDAVGSDEVIPIGFDMIAIGGAYVSVGLVGTQIKIPLFPLIRKECQYLGSLWVIITILGKL